MRRASYDNRSSSGSSAKRNFVSNQGYQTRSSLTTKDVDCKRMNYNLQANSHLQRSVSADNVVVRTRGFKPSDRHDPAKRHFLEHLTSKILHFEMDSGEAKPINLQKLLTPAMDSSDLLLAKHSMHTFVEYFASSRNTVYAMTESAVKEDSEKMYASSCFYAPTHPTVEDQVELARRISYSLSDVKNMKSKGQSMYVNRKKRSVKWIHDGNGDEEEDEPPSPVHKDKVPLKCMMNPNGKVLDIHGIQALGEEVNIGTSPSNAEKLFDIVRDLNNQKGRGAEIFAKRRKRSEKWVVDKEQCQTPTTTPSGLTKAPSFPTKLDMGSNENSKFTSLPPLTPLMSTPAPSAYDTKPFYNPFTLDLSLESVTTPRTGSDQRRGSLQSENSSSAYTEVKKIYLREVAVGTEPEYPVNGGRAGVPVEKSKRMSFDASFNNMDHRHVVNGSSNINTRRNKSLNTNGNNNARESYPNNHAKMDSTNRRVMERHSHGNRNHHHHHHHHHHQQYQRCEEPQQSLEEIQDESEYTPVPVKQLIQEFEKTCRPVLQYKQISPKVIPIAQQCPPLDNDISRFFESTRMTNKFDDQRQIQQMQQQISRGTGTGTGGMIKRSTNTNKIINGNGNMNYTNGNGYSIRGAFGNQSMPNVIQQSERYEAYDSTDDEIDDSFGESDDEVNYRRADAQRIMYDDESQSFNNGNDTRATSNGTMDEYEMYVRQFDESTELFEAPPGFRNFENGDYTDNQADTANDSKSMVLAMVASQDDILDTIKHLRNTPILENLVGAPTPDFFADVGNNKLCEAPYQGPKIASFQTLTNYNTAPRGWDQSQSFYRPVTFGKQQEPIAYSDF